MDIFNFKGHRLHDKEKIKITQLKLKQMSNTMGIELLKIHA